jgi:DNA-binding HxlR family transcriptional regulator
LPASYSSLKAFRVILSSLVAFSLLETSLAILGSASSGGPLQNGNTGAYWVFWSFAPQLAVTGWFVVGATVLFGRSGRGIFARKGFEGDVYKLMVKMRGSGSRLSLLRNLEKPSHRFELAEVTGLDWKEVDRQLKVLKNFGLVQVLAESGTVKIYEMTEQGRVLIKLIDDLSKGKPE